MAAFLVVDTAIENADEYEKYKALAKPIAEKYGGVYRVRGGAMDVLETDLWTPTRMVIIEFPDMQAARAFTDSAEYAPVKPLRPCDMFRRHSSARDFPRCRKETLFTPVKPLRRNNARCSMVILDGL